MTPPRPPLRRPTADLWRGKVIRVDGNGKAFLTVKRLNRDRVFGPCDVVEGPTPIGDGDDVLVGLVEGNPEDVVVVGRI